MSNVLNRFGRWSYRNKFKSLCIWLIVLLTFVFTALKLGSNYDQNLKINGLPSTDIQATLAKEFHQNVDAGTMKIVIKNGQKNGIEQAKIKKRIISLIKNVKNNRSNGIKSITNPYTSGAISKDKSTTYIDITFNKDTSLVTTSQVNTIKKAFNQLYHRGQTQVAYTGTVQITKADAGDLSELIGIVIAFILLFVLFRSFITAGLPIISALVGLVSGILTVTIGTHLFNITSVAQTLTIMLGLAVGIDYALFIVHRYRSELNKTDPEHAMGNAIATAGSSVLFAGVTVIVAVSGLSIVGIAFLTQMGFATAVGVAFAILSALTLLPALISMLSKYIKPDSNNEAEMSNHPGLFARSIVNHPILSGLISIIILIGFAIPAKNMRLGMPYNGSLPKNNTERQAYDIISDKFGEGINAPLIGVVKLNQNQSHDSQNKSLKQITNKIKKFDGVKMIVPMANQKAIAEMKSPAYQAKLKQQIMQKVQQQMIMAIKKNPTMSSQQQQLMGKQLAMKYQEQALKLAQSKAISPIPVQISQDRQYAMFIIIPKKGTESVQTEQLTQKINRYSKQIQHHDHTKIILTGTNAVNIDTTNKLNHAIPIFAGIVIVMAFILLMFMFKSFLIPLVAMIGFGLSLMAAFGFTTLTIQEGTFKSILGISKGAPILSFLPVIFIGILFGLAMDYEVFMVSRTREEYLKTGNNKLAVIMGLKSSGPVIITAALIMIAVFGSFAMSSNITVKSIGLSLSFGILFDAFLVRLVLVPAMIRLFGKASWYFPSREHKKVK